jgi:hypothetical protein
LAQAVQNGSMWDKFGEVECVAAPRHRTAGLIAIGLDRLVVPDTYQPEVVSDNTNPIWRTNAARQNHRSLKIGHYRRRLVAGFSKAE